MVRVWYYDNSEADQREEHRGDDLDLETLKKTTGVVYYPIDKELLEEAEEFKKIKTERGYDYLDVIEIHKDTLPDYEKKLKIFFEEHLHADEEIRMILAGSGYFDVRTAPDDKWARIECVKGDLIILPAGVYHRFTLDTKNYIKAMRLFIGEPVWTALKRPQEEHPARKAYVESLQETPVSA